MSKKSLAVEVVLKRPLTLNGGTIQAGKVIGLMSPAEGVRFEHLDRALRYHRVAFRRSRSEAPVEAPPRPFEPEPAAPAPESPRPPEPAKSGDGQTSLVPPDSKKGEHRSRKSKAAS